MQQLIEFVGNNLFWVSLWFALLVLLVWNQFGHALQGVIQVEPMEATRMLSHEHAALLDIRGATDFANGHILNAVNMVEAELGQKKPELEKMKKKPLIVYCQNGMSAPRVVRQLKSDGFTAVYSLKGGFAMWLRTGLPMSRSVAQSGQVTAS